MKPKEWKEKNISEWKGGKVIYIYFLFFYESDPLKFLK